MAERKQISIIASITPVGPRAAALKDQWFALHLAAGYTCDDGASACGGPDPEKELLPWNWQIGSIVVLAARATGHGSFAYGVFNATQAVNAPRTPLLAAGAEAKVKAWVDVGKSDLTFHRTPQTRGDDNPQPILAEDLTFLSTLPGNLPGKLNLVRYFKIGEAADLPGYDLKDVDQIEQFIAAPAIDSFVPKTAQVFTFPEMTGPDPHWWVPGWRYVNAEGGADDLRAAFVKPVQVELVEVALPKKEHRLRFDKEEFTGEPSLTADSFGLSFKDYWIRSSNVQPWAFEIGQRCLEVAQTAQRMAQAADLINHSDQEISVTWAKLRLMELARHSQWLAPTGAAPGNLSDQLIAAVASSLVLTPVETIALRQAVGELRTALTTDAAIAFQHWMALLERAVGKQHTTLAELFQFVLEDKSLADSMLLAQWDYAVSLSANGDLKSKWNAAATNKPFRKLFINPDGNQQWGAQKLFEQRQAELLHSILGDQATKQKAKSAEEARQFLRAELIALEKRIGSELPADYLPRLITKDAVGADKWVRIWEGESVGDGKTGGWNGAVEAYLKTAWEGMIEAPATEKKPGGLTLQLDDAVREDDATPVEDADAWRKVAGIGLLVREQGQARWQIVSAATMQLRAVKVKSVYRLDGDPPNQVRALVEINQHAKLDAYTVTVGAVTAEDLFTVKEGRSDASARGGGITIRPGSMRPGQIDEVMIEVGGADFQNTGLPDIGFGKLFTDPALVPVRAPYRSFEKDGPHVRYPFVTYNQRSLIAPSPLGDAPHEGVETRNEQDTTSEPLSAYEYGPVLNAQFQDLKLVRLRFGRQYEMAPFLIDTAGGLPAELSNGKPPWMFDGTTAGVNGNLPPGVVQTFECLRRVPVGQLRIGKLVEAGKPEADWQSTPDNCFPLAREIEAHDGEVDLLNPRKAAQPLVLLARGDESTALVGKSFSFGIRPPTVDIETLERWEIEPQTPLGGVLNDYFTRLNDRKPTPEGQVPELEIPDSNSDLTLDDPAVTNYLFVLETYNWDTLDWAVAEAGIVPKPQGAAASGIAYFQSPWLQVICSTDKSAKPPDTDKNSQQNTVSFIIASDQATVARLKVHALVDKRFVKSDSNNQEARFPSGFFTPFPPGIDEAAHHTLVAQLADYVCLAPFTLLIEIANADMPDEAALWQTLRAQVQLPGKNGVRLSLTPSADATADSLARFRNIARCDLIKQAWRWQGRPLQPLPFVPEQWPADASAVDSDPNVLKWEAGAFAELDDQLDSLTIPLRYPVKLSSPKSADSLYEDRLARDVRACYLHYAVRAYSRYEGLFAKKTAKLSRQPVTVGSGGAKKEYHLSGPGWRRAFLPYRGVKQPKPVIKAIVPLTGAFEEAVAAGQGSQVTPLMVVADETMFSICGITESIECRIEKVELRDGVEVECGGEKRHELYQIGRDPILSEFSESSKCETPVMAAMTGPFGHTFDTDARQSLFSSSSYTLPPYSGCQPWDFAKIRFRRLTGNAAVDALTATVNEENWTKPIWVQFLPSSTFGLQIVKVETKRVSETGQTLQFELTFKGSAMDDKLISQRQYRFFTFGLILTRLIHDFRGKDELEVYTAACSAHVALSQDKQDTVVRFTVRSGVQGGRLRARLVEVQELPPKSEKELQDRHSAQYLDNDFWRRLLDAPRDGQDLLDAEARITRVSPSFAIDLDAAIEIIHE